VTLFSTGITHGEPERITAGPDGNLWFTEQGEQGARSHASRPPERSPSSHSTAACGGSRPGPTETCGSPEASRSVASRQRERSLGSGPASMLKRSLPARTGTYGSPSPIPGSSDESIPNPVAPTAQARSASKSLTKQTLRPVPALRLGGPHQFCRSRFTPGRPQTSPRSRRSCRAELTDGAPLADHHVGVAGGAGQEHDVRDVVGFPFLGLVCAALAKRTSLIWARNGIREIGSSGVVRAVDDLLGGDSRQTGYARDVIEQIASKLPFATRQTISAGSFSARSCRPAPSERGCRTNSGSIPMPETELQRQYREDARVLGKLGWALASTKLPRVEVCLRRSPAEKAVAAWEHEGDERPPDPEPTSSGYSVIRRRR
jgi:hypothetical protein